MKITASVIILFGWTCLIYPVTGNTAETVSSSKTNTKHVNTLNQFAQRLHILHQHQTTQNKIFKKESTGGYRGGDDFYREVKYFDKKTGNLLSRVMWEIDKPEQIHEIEVFVYDDNGRLKRDYLAAFLPVHRNAPIQALINLHHQNDELKSFRQFEASGEKIYEYCEGKFFGEPLNISLDDNDFVEYSQETMKLMDSEEYLACFGKTMATLGDYVNPLFGLSLSADLMRKADMHESETDSSVEQKLKKLTKIINKDNTSATLFSERGMVYLKMRAFDKAIDDFSRAIELDDSLDNAYYGRGLAFGRLRMFDQGIEDLTVYINRNPQSSVAYTKRGVRRIWAGQYKLAEEDLKTAISIDPENAEAYDDLGVMDARKGHYKKAQENFKKVVEIDSSYSKGFHNLAMTYYILGDHSKSLVNINKSLELKPNDKNALLLKGEIMLKLGMRKEAMVILDKAEFLPEGGWQERFAIQ